MFYNVNYMSRKKHSPLDILSLDNNSNGLSLDLVINLCGPGLAI